MVPDSALNHYLVIACDFGIPLMLLNLGLILVPLSLGAMVFRRLEDVKLRFVVAILIVSNCIFLLMINTMQPSYFLGVLWIWSAQLAMLVVIAQQHGVQINLPATTFRRLVPITAAALMALTIFIGSYHTVFGANGYAARLTSPWWMH